MEKHEISYKSITWPHSGKENLVIRLVESWWRDNNSAITSADMTRRTTSTGTTDCENTFHPSHVNLWWVFLSVSDRYEAYGWRGFTISLWIFHRKISFSRFFRGKKVGKVNIAPRTFPFLFDASAREKTIKNQFSALVELSLSEWKDEK